MDRAINKTTNEIVSAFEVYKNGSYQNLNKGEWIAPNDSIYNLDENLSKEDTYTHYVKEKEFKNWKKTLIWYNPYFAKYPGSKMKTISESPEHKALKNWLFNRLKKDDLKLVYSKAGKKNQYNNSIKLSELNIDWNKYDIEVHTKGYKALRADILIQFKNKHPFLGQGIFFEIQLSSQIEKITFNRSIERAIQGYSTVWLFKKDFELSEDLSEIEFKNNVFKINSFSSELKYNGSTFIKRLKHIVEEQCRYLDIKKEELINKTEEVEEYKTKVINDIKEKIDDFFSYKIKELSQNFEEEVAKKVQDNFFEENKIKMKPLIEEALESFLDFKTLQQTINKIDIQTIISNARTMAYNKIKNYNLYKEAISNPPKCNGCNHYLILGNGKFGIWWKCPNYPSCTAKNNHSIPNEIKDLFEDEIVKVIIEND